MPFEDLEEVSKIDQQSVMKYFNVNTTYIKLVLSQLQVIPLLNYYIYQFIDLSFQIALVSMPRQSDY